MHEQRATPRITLPFEVELTHPALGTVRTCARDISANGLFVHLPDSGLQAGARVQVTVQTLDIIDPSPTPTVQMAVRRVTDQGVGLETLNRTNNHLWQTIDRRRRELAVGQDYFQVHQSALVHDPERGVLVQQVNGRWLLPGGFLQVGDDRTAALVAAVRGATGWLVEPGEVVDAHSIALAEVPEAAVLTLFVRCTPVTAPADPSATTRWVRKAVEIDDLTFTSDHLRTLVRRIVAAADDATA